MKISNNNWYKLAQAEQQPQQQPQQAPNLQKPQQAQPQQQQNTQPQQPQQQNPQQPQKQQPNQLNEKAVEKEIVQQGSKIRQAAINWLINNEEIVRYLQNPTEQARNAIATKAVSQALTSIVKELSPAAGFLFKSINLGDAMQKMPGLRQISESIGKFIAESLKIGQIPDEISSQSKILQQWDLPDKLAQQFQGKIAELNKIDPKLAQNFIIIIMRLKNDNNLLAAEQQLVGAKYEGWYKSSSGHGRFSKDLSDIIEGYVLSHKSKPTQAIAQIIKNDLSLQPFLQEEQMSDEELSQIIEETKLLYKWMK